MTCLLLTMVTITLVVGMFNVQVVARSYCGGIVESAKSIFSRRSINNKYLHFQSFDRNRVESKSPYLKDFAVESS